MPKPGVIVDVVGRASAEPDDEPSLGDVVEHRDLLGGTDRVVQRHLQHGKTELGLPRRRRQRAGKADRVGIGADPVEMVLGEPDHIAAEFVGEPCLAQRLVDYDAVPLGIAAVGKQEIAEFQHSTSKPLRPEPIPPGDLS